MSRDMLSGDPVYDVLKKSKDLIPFAEAVDWTISDTFTKGIEEFGEFSEACMIRLGKLKTKDPVTDDDIVAEAADITICILDALARVLPNKSASELFVLFGYMLEKKSDKWVSKFKQE